MDYSTQILDYTTTFLHNLGGQDEIGLQVAYSPDENIYHISLSTPNPAILIGYHGDTLSAFQLILAQHLFAQTGEWLSLSVNINDYRERRESSLQAMADSVVSKVLSTGQPQTLPPMPANERRMVHMYLGQNPEVTTESTGEGRTRSVVISPKASQDLA